MCAGTRGVQQFSFYPIWRRQNHFLTIAIPTFNSAHFLPDAISSIVGQGPDDFEVLSVHNASEDNEGRRVIKALAAGICAGTPGKISSRHLPIWYTSGCFGSSISARLFRLRDRSGTSQRTSPSVGRIASLNGALLLRLHGVLNP